ncbi:MAG: single-stranded-DNA-specific exonuclease RecJ [Panacagrimonas sp.]
MLELRRRIAPAHHLPAQLHPVVARVLAARGICEPEQLKLELRHLLPPASMRGTDQASACVVRAIQRRQRIVIAGDYDCDGATGVALAVLGLRRLGADHVDYVVPNRLTMGYGLSVPLAELAAARGAQLLITVDNGIASHAGVAAARALGLQVVVTDHHLPGAELPDAHALINPNQAGCDFASKHLAGVGVMFYLLLAVRAELRVQGAFAAGEEPNLAELLDLVALGTVADLVKLDRNNRILVAAGLARIRAGRSRPGVRALLKLAGRNEAELDASDLGFVLGPRINAAGRIDDIGIGIRCLLSEDDAEAAALAHQLDQINRLRRQMQDQMNDAALAQLLSGVQTQGYGLCLFDAQWHEGVVGLVASKLREVANRPAIAFAPAQEPGVLKGSARSVPGLHLRDVLAAIDAAEPGLILRFGGHAMAAGLSLTHAELEKFSACFDAYCRAQLTPAQLERVIETDGPLDAEHLSVETVAALEQAGPWGQGMPEPLFDNAFEICGARTVGADQRHVRYRLRLGQGPELTAVHFGGAEQMQTRGRMHAAYSLCINRWQGASTLELRLSHVEPLSPESWPQERGLSCSARNCKVRSSAWRVGSPAASIRWVVSTLCAGFISRGLASEASSSMPSKASPNSSRRRLKRSGGHIGSP